MTKGQAPKPGRTGSTRDRLIDAALHLFAERGFRGTTVGEIEEAAGLAPRSGALYKHFANKHAVLEAALERHIQEVRTIAGVMDLLPLGDLRSELTLLGRWLLQELEGEREVTRLIEKEGEQFPELVARMREEVVQTGYEQAAEYARRRLTGADGDLDPEAVAAVAVGAMINYRRMQWTLGEAPGKVDEERFLDTWVDVLMRAAGPDAE